MGLSNEVCEKLRKPMEKYTRRGQGGTYSYYKGSDVIRRLNDAFGHSWSSERVEAEVLEDQVLMLVSLMVFCGGDALIHHGYGSAPFIRVQGKVDVGNAYKSAYTNALKKAAEQFGIGLGGDDEDTPRESTSFQEPVAAPVPRPTATAPTVNSTTVTAPRTPMKRPAALPARPGGNGQGIRVTAVAALSRPVVSMPGAAAPSPLSEPIPVSMPGAAAPSPLSEPIPVPDLGDEMLTGTQETALKSLSKLRGLTEEGVVQGALSGTEKTMFKQLLKSEAIKVIRFANKLPPQR